MWKHYSKISPFFHWQNALLRASLSVWGMRRSLRVLVWVHIWIFVPYLLHDFTNCSFPIFFLESAPYLYHFIIHTLQRSTTACLGICTHSPRFKTLVWRKPAICAMRKTCEELVRKKGVYEITWKLTTHVLWFNYFLIQLFYPLLHEKIP